MLNSILHTVNCILKHKARYYRGTTLLGLCFSILLNNPDLSKEQIPQIKKTLIGLETDHNAIKREVKILIKLINKKGVKLIWNYR